MILFLLGTALGSVVDDPEFRFCHENRAFAWNETLCPLLERVPEGQCPGLESFCNDPASAPAAGCQDPGGQGGISDRSDADSTPDPRLDFPELPDLGLGALLDLSGGMVWLLAFLVVVLVAGLGVALATAFGRRRDLPLARVETVALPEQSEEEAFELVVDDVPDLPADALLGAAREALAAGDPGRAAVLTRGAVLKELGERGVLRLHRSRTDREYVRQADSTLRPDLDQVMRVAEQHRWAQVPLTAERVQQALEAARRLLVAGLFLLLALPASAMDRYGPIGDVGLFRLIEQSTSEEVRFRRGALQGLAEDDLDVLVLDTAGVAPDEQTWEEIGDWVESGHLLVVLGDLDAFDIALGGTETDCRESTLPAPWMPGGLDVYQDLDGGLLGCGEAGTLVAYVPRGDGLLVGVAETRLAWNGALAVPENEAFWLALFGHLEDVGWIAGPVEVATWGAGGDGNPPTSALANLDLLPFALQVLVLWCAVALWKGRRFVRPRGRDADAGRPFEEHVLALGAQYRQLGDPTHALREHARWLITTRSPDRLRHDALRAGFPAERVPQLVEAIQALAHDQPVEHPVSMEELWTLMRAD